jgi:hypothetical protein
VASLWRSSSQSNSHSVIVPAGCTSRCIPVDFDTGRLEDDGLLIPKLPDDRWIRGRIEGKQEATTATDASTRLQIKAVEIVSNRSRYP